MSAPTPAPAPATVKPSTAAAVIAALLPLVFPFVSFCMLLVLAEGVSELLHMLEEGGAFSWVVLLLTAFSAAILAVLLFLGGKGFRVPAAIGLFVAVLPWLGGLAGMRLGIGVASDAIAYADAASRAVMMARGISEASTLRFLGTAMAASLLGALAVGWGIAALGQRAPNKKLWLAAPFALLGLMGMVLIVFMMFETSRASVVLAMLSAFGAMLALALGGAGAGADTPHARAAALASAASLAALVGCIAAVDALETRGMIEAFGAVAGADPSMKTALLAQGASEMIAASRAAMIGGIVLALGAIGVTAWSATRVRPSAGRIAGGVAAVLVAGLALLLDSVAMGGVGDDMARIAQPPWAAVVGFVPVQMAGDPPSGELHATVSPDRVTIRATGAMVPLAAGGDPASRGPLVQAFRAQLPPPRVVAEPPPLDPFGPVLDRQPGLVAAEGPELVLAIDERLPAASLRNVAAAAREAGAASILLVGIPPTSPESAAAMADLVDSAPLIAPILHSTTAVRFQLEDAGTHDVAAMDPVLFHTTVGAAPVVMVQTRPGSPEAGFRLDTGVRSEGRSRWDRPADDQRRRVYVALADDATAGRLAALVDHLAASDRTAVLVTGAIPGNPSGPSIAPPPSPDGVGILGLFGGGGPGARGEPGQGGYGRSWGSPGDPNAGPQVRTGSADVLGSLSREVIRRVIARHMNEVRHCYEQQLTANPNLEGRVTIGFVIGPTGSVQTAEVADSTLGNPAAEACIAGAVRRWTFPAPDGGGIVRVNYPFVLRTAQ